MTHHIVILSKTEQLFKSHNYCEFWNKTRRDESTDLDRSGVVSQYDAFEKVQFKSHSSHSWRVQFWAVPWSQFTLLSSVPTNWRQIWPESSPVIRAQAEGNSKDGGGQPLCHRASMRWPCQTQKEHHIFPAAPWAIPQVDNVVPKRVHSHSPSGLLVHPSLFSFPWEIKTLPEYGTEWNLLSRNLRPNTKFLGSQFSNPFFFIGKDQAGTFEPPVGSGR